MYDLPDLRWAAKRGMYFKATNGTPGTAITGTNQASFSVNSGLFLFQNNQAAKGIAGRPQEATSPPEVYVIPHYVMVSIVAADTTSAAGIANFLGVLDTIPRFNAGGTQLIIPEFGAANALLNSPSPGDTSSTPMVVPVTRLQVGAVGTTNAGTFRSLADRQTVRVGSAAGACFVPGDKILFTFGDDLIDQTNGPMGGANAGIFTVPCGPIVLPPQCSYVGHFWVTNQTAAFTFEIQVGWLEIPAGAQ